MPDLPPAQTVAGDAPERLPWAAIEPRTTSSERRGRPLHHPRCARRPGGAGACSTSRRVVVCSSPAAAEQEDDGSSTVARAAVDGATPDEVALFVIDCASRSSARCATCPIAQWPRPATTSSRSPVSSSCSPPSSTAGERCCPISRSSGNAVGVSRQGPLAAAHRGNRRRLSEPQRDPRHGATDGDGPARLDRRVPPGRHRRPTAGHPRRARRRPPSRAGAADVVDRPAARDAPSRRAGLRRLRYPAGDEPGARAARRSWTMEQPAQGRSHRRRPIGERARRGDHRVRPAGSAASCRPS